MRLFVMLGCAVFVAGCDGSLGSGARDASGVDGGARQDAAGVDGGRPDGGPGVDAGRPDLDVGVPDLDAASPGLDAGTPGVDAASGPDTGAPGTDGGTPLPTFETVFSHRSATNAADTAIEDRIIALIDAAVPGSRIRVAMYSFTRSTASAALVRAHARGVDVRIVLDGGADGIGSEVGALRTGLGAANVHMCDAPGTSCIGTGIMHNKFFLFSELADGSRNVVIQASHNLTNAQLSMHNNAVIIRGDDLLFAAYEHTWNDLWADIENPNYYRIDDGALATRAYFFPRGSGGDTSVSILDNVTCDGTARVRVAMAFFTDARSAVADALARLARAGCDVRVVAGDASIPLGTTVASTLTSAGVQLTRYPTRSGWDLHSKYIVIDALYSGSTTHRHLVFTGSHNWTGPSLTDNDETQLRVEDEGVFTAFMTDWDHVRASAVRP
jgi:phosphatidylserine/phosphatidylglycerophosphate/cardiolipin synthase-like enzyme